MNWLKELIRMIIFPFLPEEIEVESCTRKAKFFFWLYGQPDSISDETGRVYPPDYDFSQDPWNKV